MTDKFEALKAQLPDALAAWCESNGGKVTLGWIHNSNPVVVSELLAALEEKDQQVKELEEFAKLALDKIPNEKVSPDFYIVGNGPCFLAYPESMGPEARCDLAGNLRKAYLSPTHWKERAKAAEQREEHLKSDAAVMGQRIAKLERANAAQDDHINQQQDRIETLEKRNGELGKYTGQLEQRLQQPIKLRKCDIGIACEFVSDHIVVSLAAVLVEAATAGFRAEVEGE